MKAALLIALVATLVASVASTSCSIDHPSDAIACDTQADCDGTRTCVDGYCVVATSNPPGCPAGCASCDVAMKTCAITGTPGKATCPPGWTCTITCTGNTCSEVDCTNATACTVMCSGAGACDVVKCGQGRCTVTCGGADSCTEVDCRESCACSVACTGDSSCGATRCPGQCAAGAGCMAQIPTCSRC